MDGGALTRLTDVELPAFLRERELTRRRADAEQLRAVAEIQARGLAGEQGNGVSAGWFATCSR
ncbi:hypothetical protein [Saccharomonospora marina]|nr:hypothetical protein [Saccharomonospora marina]